MCLGRCPRVHTPPAIPPIATSARTLCQRTLALRRLPAQRFVGLAAAASQRRDAARSLGRERLTRDRCARTPGIGGAMPCPAQAARATQHLSTRRSVMPLGRMAGRAGRCTTASSRCATSTQRLATTALDSPAPALCGLGFRRDRAGQPPNRTSIRAGNECVPVSRAVQRGRPRPTLRGADGQAQSNCVRFALEGPDRPCQSHKA